MKTVDRNQALPIFFQLQNIFFDNIRTGVWKPVNKYHRKVNFVPCMTSADHGAQGIAANWKLKGW